MWKYLYRAVDSMGNTLDFMLSAKRDGKAATRFFRKVLKAEHTQKPRVITVDQNAAYPVAIETLKADETLAAETELRQSKYMNNIPIAGSSPHQAIDQAHDGIRVIQYGKTNLEGHRSDEYDSQRTGERNQPREESVSSEVYRRTVRYECITECERNTSFVTKKYLRHNRSRRRKGVP
ncbi:MAG: DDE-type integrase/transposase/recombinase [Plectolyngbya sp. WJT66-NPBG17]|nr:DDE-type integrase/transposase/recombinase [Plectolyngbya sp. WJT66-NPBG17]